MIFVSINFWVFLKTECDADEFLCGNGVVCYPASKKCDGSLDCEDASDEMECGMKKI